MFKKKKKEGEMPDLHKADMPEMEPAMKKAKLGVLGHLSDMASEAMGSKLGGLKKVSVASDSKEGLKAGIDKAKELVESGHLSPDASELEEGSPEEEASESPEEESAEGESGEGYEDMSAEDIDKKLQELMALKKKKESMKA